MTKETFMQVYGQLKTDILSEFKQFPKEALEYLEEMMDYTVVGGKMNRGLSVYHSFQYLVSNVEPQDQWKANALGWCVEWLQAMFLVADDIMDHSETRRGQPCWYKKEKVGNMAINDSFILESGIYLIIKKYFKSTSYYADLLDLFHDVSFKTEMGQLMDLITAPEDNVDLTRFSLERFTLIVQYKTSYYSFYLPVALAMLMAGIKDEKSFKTAESILIPLGNFFQAQDDYLDCFGDPAVIGKIGTDIQDNKCSWLINQALKRASPDQYSILENNYGKRMPENEAKVKQVYRDLNLQQIYKEYEESSYLEIMGLIDNVDSLILPKQIFIDFANRIYKRNK